MFSVTPELKEEPHWNYYEKNREVFDAPKGTLNDRKKYKKYFNKRVKEECEKREFIYLSIYDYIENHNNKELFYLDDLHLHPKNVNFLVLKELLKLKK